MTNVEFGILKEGGFVHTQRHEYIFVKVEGDWATVFYESKKGIIVTEEYHIEFFLEHFTLGKHPDNVKPTPEQPQQITVAEAINQGLKVGDKITLEFEVMHVTDDKKPLEIWNKELHFGAWLSEYLLIPFTPQPYIPKHREFCAVTTTTGLTTECEVFESNGRLFAISLKDGKPDGVFSPEQIQKFLPLTK